MTAHIVLRLLSNIRYEVVPTPATEAQVVQHLPPDRGLFARLAAPGGFTGERFVLDSVSALHGTDARSAGLHVFTFNQIAEAEVWRVDLLPRLAG